MLLKRLPPFTRSDRLFYACRRPVLETMAAIDASSRKINDINGTINGTTNGTINGTIDGIAFQIKQLIAASSEHVTLGNQRVADAGATMTAVVDSVRKLTQIMAQIAAATAEQGSGIEQVNVAVAQMDQMTQQNAALVGQASAAAEAMQQQAAQLLSCCSRWACSSCAPKPPPHPWRTLPAPTNRR